MHVQHALLPLVRRMGLRADLHILRPGYVPTGGGSLALTTEPVQHTLCPLSMPERREALRYAMGKIRENRLVPEGNARPG